MADQTEHSETNQETIRRRARGQAEDDLERVTLWTRQPLEPIEQAWPEQRHRDAGGRMAQERAA